MPKFTIRVTQTVTNEFTFEAKNEKQALSKAVDFFNQAKNLDIDTQTVNVTPRFLEECQDDTSDLVAYTHFDCWGPKGGGHDDVTELWEWNSPQSCSLVKKLAKQWNKLQLERHIPEEKRFDFLKFANDNYLMLGQEPYFLECGKKFIELGFSVYNSDSMFEVYAL